MCLPCLYYHNLPIPTAMPLEESMYTSPPPLRANASISRIFSLLYLLICYAKLKNVYLFITNLYFALVQILIKPFDVCVAYLVCSTATQSLLLLTLKIFPHIANLFTFSISDFHFDLKLAMVYHAQIEAGLT